MNPITMKIFGYVVRAIVLCTAMPVHEYAHGYVASRLGDNTARNQGRLTLNPKAHLDLVGSLCLIFMGFGWAKPVQVNTRNFQNPKRDMALTSLAGPASNILLALAIMIIYKLLLGVAPIMRFNSPFIVAQILDTMIRVNLWLAVFNFIPIPPLDGSKIFAAILPDKYYNFIMLNERYVYILLIALVVTGVLSGPLNFISSGIYAVLNLLTSPINILFR